MISPLEAVCSFVSICLAKLTNMALSYLSCVIQMAKLTTTLLFTLVNRRPQRDLATKVVMTLHEKYPQAGHTVCTDNYYTSIPLTNELIQTELLMNQMLALHIFSLDLKSDFDLVVTGMPTRQLALLLFVQCTKTRFISNTRFTNNIRFTDKGS